MKVKTQIILFLLLLFCFFSACSNKEVSSDKNKIPPIMKGTAPVESDFIQVGGSVRKVER